MSSAWSRSWPWRSRAVRDWTVALGLLGLGVVDITVHAHSESFPDPLWAHYVFLAAGSLPLAFRRFWPASVAVLVLAAFNAWSLVMYPSGEQASFEAFLGMLAAFYILGADLVGRRQLVVTALVVLATVPGWLFSLGYGASPGDALPALVFLTLAWTTGYVLRRRREQLTEERLRADRLAYEQGRLAAEAVMEERSRMARELHDVVAHGLSLIVVQAAAERRALAQERSSPEASQAVLEAVENAGREALAELRLLLGLLRRPDEEPSLRPQPSLRHLDQVLDAARASGLDVEVSVDDAAVEALSAGLDLTAYRIVQECLTNVVKHAGARRVRVHVHRTARDLEVDVLDDGPGVGQGLPEGGHGLTGMRERVAVYGGSLLAGPAEPGPGFRVHARIPLTGPLTDPAPTGRV
ncbi:MAG TPA: histidine kinase [Nocardioides sp.]|uniref:sensor histidine kinase n=1 Tax=Nocardioides sp. TaxID=35761 RepID=UPI002E372714|nr:histidine kinase [Nocardioides sp.]HEX5086529.1 histidine kinase [Nocardioides sp.]